MVLVSWLWSRVETVWGWFCKYLLIMVLVWFTQTFNKNINKIKRGWKFAFALFRCLPFDHLNPEGMQIHPLSVILVFFLISHFGGEKYFNNNNLVKFNYFDSYFKPITNENVIEMSQDGWRWLKCFNKRVKGSWWCG